MEASVSALEGSEIVIDKAATAVWHGYAMMLAATSIVGDGVS